MAILDNGVSAMKGGLHTTLRTVWFMRTPTSRATNVATAGLDSTENQAACILPAVWECVSMVEHAKVAIPRCVSAPLDLKGPDASTM